MPTYLDPTGPVPAPDSNGRVELRETFGFGDFTATLFSAAIGSLGIIYWLCWFLHDLPHFLETIQFELSATALLSAFLLVRSQLTRFLKPDRLVIDDTGVTLTGPKGRHLTWQDLQEISTKVVDFSGPKGSPKPKTVTRISGPQGSLEWSPVFGVIPEDLASYISRRHDACTTGASINYTRPPLSKEGQQWLGVLRVMQRLGGVTVVSLTILAGLTALIVWIWLG